MVAAVSFVFPCLSPLRAEIQALLYSLMFFGRLHRQLLVESDCIHATQAGNSHLLLLPEFSRLHMFLSLTGSHIAFVPREINMVAHHLAQHARMFPTTTLYSSAGQLPSAARGFYFTDCTTYVIRT